MMYYHHMYEPELHCRSLVLGVVVIVSLIALVQYLF